VGNRLLGVAEDATQVEIKSAYRAAALQVHPDVSDAPDANEKFAELSSAYGEPHVSRLEAPGRCMQGVLSPLFLQCPFSGIEGCFH
jgi:hypothetical protein